MLNRLQLISTIISHQSECLCPQIKVTFRLHSLALIKTDQITLYIAATSHYIDGLGT